MASTRHWTGLAQREGQVYGGFSSACGDCEDMRANYELEERRAAATAEEHRRQRRAMVERRCAALGMPAPDDPDDDDPYGPGSADVFYDIGAGNRDSRRLPGGLTFALPDEAGPDGRAPQPTCKPAACAEEMSVQAEPEPDWAPAVTVAAPGAAAKTYAKGSDYYYNFDGAASSAFELMKQNMLGAPTALYDWLNTAHRPEQPPEPPPFDEPPPRRSDYPTGRRAGNEGRKQYHKKRAEWYHNVTGHELTGELAEQNELFDTIARRYRAYNDDRTQRPRACKRRSHECEEQYEG